MNQHNAEDIVRRATAAFNSGRPDEARSSANKGLSRAPGEPMLHHLLAAVLFSRNEIQPARTHIETSLAKRPGNAAAHLLAARIARDRRRFRRRIVPSGSRDRDRAATGSLYRKGTNAGSGRSPAAGARGLADHPEVVPQHQRGRRTAGTVGMGGRRHTPSPRPTSNARRETTPRPRSGSTLALSARICATTQRRDRLTASARQKT